MKFNINIDQRFCLEWGLNFAEGAVFGILYNLSSWADPVVIDGQIFYHASRNKVMDELPMLTDKPDTIYRIFKHLSDPQRALIQYEKDGRKDLIRLTDRGKTWNSEKNPSLADNSENFPAELGKKSENNSEKNPTDNNTSIISTTIDRENAPEKIPPPVVENPNALQWGDGAEMRLEKANALVRGYVLANPERLQDMCKQARNRCNETGFWDELGEYLRHHADNYQIMQNPVKALTSGPSNFVSWLSKPWCRDKYLTAQPDQPKRRATSHPQPERERMTPEQALALREKYAVK
ncbi:MAG: hypothetical protein IPJ00_17410 [Saprospirales bacterium]|nr:hypothetical protein [Saprospirales bacterium]